jgi:circadian clock protein KaiC
MLKKENLPNPNRVTTGVPGFDEMLGGGFPRGQLILVLAEPGAGRTVFATQFLAAGLSTGENGVYVSFKESKAKFMTEAKSFGWDFESAEKDNKFAFVNWSPWEMDEENFSADGFLAATENGVNSVNATRIVVDPIDTLRYFYTDMEERKLIFKIFKKFHRFNATCIFVTALRYRGAFPTRELQPEEYLTQGTIVMQTTTTSVVNSDWNSPRRITQRTIEVERMPDTPIDRQPRPYRITNKGIEVYPREAVI